ncbi:hypothetical protein MVEN_02321200 [Mycena venus]|uniref:Uncharacterized protein n=1 Tax=Mycena venus TaxID=2733690 RepID=A0A8H7CF53_9AGAR|nr:hypothetical protein MVEN_02321200 [Mycena venus]
MERVVRPAIYLLGRTLRPAGGSCIPPNTLTRLQHMLVRDSISQIIQVLDFVCFKANVTDNIDVLKSGPSLSALLELQTLLATYYDKPPPLLDRCLRRSLAKSGQLVDPIPDFPAPDGIIWIGL